MTQLSLEYKKKRTGMKRAVAKNPEILSLFRTMALILADNFPVVTIDDVRKYADMKNVQYVPGNWMGSIFTGDGWEWTGEVKPSTHEGSHGRLVKVWRRK